VLKKGDNMLKLILVRHAITEDNKVGKLSGHIDSVLSEEGKKQITYLTQFLKDECIDKIYTTTSSRTKHTVERLSKEKGIDIIEKEALKEISFGDFEGIDFNEIKSIYPEEFQKMIDSGYEYRYPNGESLIDSYDRVVKEVDEIIEKNDNKTVLICSHGGTIRNIITYLISNSYEYHWNFKIDNCSVTTIEIDNKFAVLTSMNNTNFIKS
ncbi:MAG: histidine phosphatase family protein, partial [Peptostreptococcaceae bacterium]